MDQYLHNLSTIAMQRVLILHNHIGILSRFETFVYPIPHTNILFSKFYPETPKIGEREDVYSYPLWLKLQYLHLRYYGLLCSRKLRSTDTDIRYGNDTTWTSRHAISSKIRTKTCGGHAERKMYRNYRGILWIHIKLKNVTSIELRTILWRYKSMILI